MAQDGGKFLFTKPDVVVVVAIISIVVPTFQSFIRNHITLSRGAMNTYTHSKKGDSFADQCLGTMVGFLRFLSTVSTVLCVLFPNFAIYFFFLWIIHPNLRAVSCMVSFSLECTVTDVSIFHQPGLICINRMID